MRELFPNCVDFDAWYFKKSVHQEHIIGFRYGTSVASGSTHLVKHLQGGKCPFGLKNVSLR